MHTHPTLGAQQLNVDGPVALVAVHSKSFQIRQPWQQTHRQSTHQMVLAQVDRDDMPVQKPEKSTRPHARQAEVQRLSLKKQKLILLLYERWRKYKWHSYSPNVVFHDLMHPLALQSFNLHAG
jgi:hypothetical protein